MKFKPGDKIVRIIDNFMSVKVGDIVVVDRVINPHAISLRDKSGEYDITKFVLLKDTNSPNIINFLP